jgi:hypothetical protein
MIYRKISIAVWFTAATVAVTEFVVFAGGLI